MTMRNITVLLVLILLSSNAYSLEIWINEKLWTPPGSCMIHSESLLSAPKVDCIQGETTVEIILDSSYKSLAWVKEKIPAIREEALLNGDHFTRGKA